MTCRWVDSLPDPEGQWWAEGDLGRAAYWLAAAIDPGLPEYIDTYGGFAAALIRRNRKTLGVTSERYADLGNGLSDEALLWRALYRVSNAARLEVAGREPVWAADDLREAEAALRTLHKRRQERAS